MIFAPVGTVVTGVRAPTEASDRVKNRIRRGRRAKSGLPFYRQRR